MPVLKKHVYRFCLLVGCAVTILFSACDPDPDSVTMDPIPEQVLHYAGGIYELVEDVVTRAMHYDSYDFGDGRSFQWQSDTVLLLTVTGFIAEPAVYPDPDLVLNGSLTMTILKNDPWKLGISGTIETSGASSDTSTINGSVLWSRGDNPEDNHPASMSGTFVVNGISYDMSRIFFELKKDF